jgi:hypothetical protein
MATNKYVNATQEAGGKAMGGASFPGQVLTLVGTYEKAAGDNDTSVLRLGTVPATAIPLPHSFIGNDALAGATDVDIGVYKQSNGPVDGAVVDKDCLSDGLDIAAGNALGSEIRAFQAVALDEFGQDLRTLAGGSVGDGNDFYDIAITGNTFGVAAGTISWELNFLLPQS